jgi:hypothetical protein
VGIDAVDGGAAGFEEHRGDRDTVDCGRDESSIMAGSGAVGWPWDIQILI